jgi:hypothetical protein
VVATAVYNAVEAGVGVAAGIAAGSVALIGFGLDSVLELIAAGGLLWRLSVERRGATAEAVEASERRVQRLVGWTFFVLAAYVAAEAGWTLWRREAPEERRRTPARILGTSVPIPTITSSPALGARHRAALPQRWQALPGPSRTTAGHRLAFDSAETHELG